MERGADRPSVSRRAIANPPSDVPPICIAKPRCHEVPRGGEMRRIEYSRRREEASCGVRGEL